MTHNDGMEKKMNEMEKVDAQLKKAQTRLINAQAQEIEQRVAKENRSK